MTIQEISVFRKGSSNPSLHSVNLANNLANLIPTIKIPDYSEEKKKKKEENLLALSIVIKKYYYAFHVMFKVFESYRCYHAFYS
jgi:hypothetical protein